MFACQCHRDYNGQQRFRPSTDTGLNKVIKNIFSKIGLLLASLLLCALLMEAGIFLLTRLNVLNINTPSYDTSMLLFKHTHMVPYDKHIGKWHVPNVKKRHTKACFDVLYETNSYGALDREHEKKSDKKRVVVLGDSYMVGWGLDYKERMSTLLEEATGVKHLNFACAGHDPVQYLQVYKTRAKEFDHEAVIIGLFPDNDLTTAHNPPEPGELYDHPFYSGHYPDYKLHLPNKLVDLNNRMDVLYSNAKRFRLKSFLKTFTYTYNAIIYVEQLIKARRAAGNGPRQIQSIYYDYAQKQIDLLRFILESMSEEAKGKKVLLFTIPRARDMEKYLETGEAPPFPREIEKICSDVGFDYLDLMPGLLEMDQDWEKLIFPCDMHLSAFGNEAATGILLQTPFYRSLESAQ